MTEGDTSRDKLDELQRLSAIGQLSAGIAHEIRNPLTAVKGFLKLMQRDQDSPYWEIVNSELEQAISTVQNLLVVSKPETNQEAWSEVNLCHLIENTLSLFDNEIYRIKFVKHFYNANTLIRGHRNQLKRAFFNLLKNAVEAIEGEGSITIEHFRTDRHVCISIQDTGKGIPEEQLNLLGTPFFSTKAESGTGLGLPQVYATVREHQGSIEAHSAEGEGTKFTLLFPQLSRSLEESHLNLTIHKEMDVREFFEINRQEFNRLLEAEAQTTFEIVAGLKFVTTNDLIEHANQIISLIHDGLTQEIIRLAQERGLAWAKSDVPIMTKMEWFYALRRVIWSFLRHYHLHVGITAEQTFELSERINDALDNFIIQFNVSFTKYRDDILKSKQAIIDELTVPLIPIFNRMAVLPLIGTLDEARMNKIEDKLLEDIERRGIQKIFIDMSGAVLVDAEPFPMVIRIVEGVNLLGCEAVVTGISARLAKVILNLKESVKDRLAIVSTLQQALVKESGDAAAGRQASDAVDSIQSAAHSLAPLT